MAVDLGYENMQEFGFQSKNELPHEAGTSGRFLLNDRARDHALPKLFDQHEFEAVKQFFQTWPDYRPTPLYRLTGLAKQLNLAEIYLKDESSRLGLNSFKVLGVAYAIARLASRNAFAKDTVLVCATDGNHGRAVAHVARRYGLRSAVFVHERTPSERIQAIEREGATVIIAKGNYDDAVQASADAAQKHGWLLISDTSWPGYETVPHDIMAGYFMLLEEASEQWPQDKGPDVVLVQVGVGGLISSVVSWMYHRYGSRRPYIIACEPASAACLLASVLAGKRTKLEGPLDTAMASLSCGLVSYLAWPLLEKATDAFATITDEQAVKAAHVLRHPRNGDPRIVAGESGACGLAVLLAMLQGKELPSLGAAAGLSPDSRVLVISTEGAIYPEDSVSRD